MFKATAQGTLKFRAEHSAMKFVEIGTSQLLASRIGLGTFRLNNAEDPIQLVQDSLNTGYNVFDTAPHFASGKCESLLGIGLKQSLKPRDEYIVVNKVGFVPANTPTFPDMYEMYCLHPNFIEYQITQSLKNMQLEAFDLYLLNNPERIVHAKDKGYTMEKCYDEIQRAFEHLKLEQNRGRIGQFGLASNTMALEQTPDHLKFDRILNLGQPSVVEYPLNIFEPDAIIGDQISLSTKCINSDVYQLTQRPLLAITPVGVHRLTNSNVGQTIDEINGATQKLFTSVMDLEYIIGAKSNLL